MIKFLNLGYIKVIHEIYPKSVDSHIQTKVMTINGDDLYFVISCKPKSTV